MNEALRERGRELAQTEFARGSLGELQTRSEFTERRWDSLSSTANSLQVRLDPIEPTDASGTPLRERAFGYATGSVARGEAADGSDLDVFVMSAPGQKAASFVEAAHIVSFLDIVRQDNDFRAFSGGGEYVRLHDFSKVLNEVGTREDDATNTFTARILLLIESRPLFNPDAYSDAKSRVLDRYWGDRPHEEPFLPIMLVNDLRRWWGAVGLNFEANHPQSAESTPRDKAQRALANLKLRYTRLLGLYSSLAALIHISGDEGLVRGDLEAVLSLTPVERIALIVGGSDHDQQGKGRDLLVRYDAAMQVLGRDKRQLLEALEDEGVARPLKLEAYEFHRLFTDFYSHIGAEKTLFQYSIA